MQQNQTQNSNRDPRILARDMYQQMLDRGFSPQEVLAFSGELVTCITQNIRCEGNA
jgi:hypothetical protein